MPPGFGVMPETFSLSPYPISRVCLFVVASQEAVPASSPALYSYLSTPSTPSWYF